jgi:2-methylcitrate dehydratase PrpD
MRNAVQTTGPRAAAGAEEALATRIARAVAELSPAQLQGAVTDKTPGEVVEKTPEAVIEKTKVCLMDLIGCAFEARDLPWSRQAVQLAAPVAEGAGAATVIGSPRPAAPGDAAFANAVMGHGLVREDMHAGSISHLGIVVLPALLALAQLRPVAGRDFVAATAAGYEVGGQIGRALMDAAIARIFRPTGISGPLAAAAAGARLLGFDTGQTASALVLAANTTAGFNQWAHTGGSEMFFHAGFAARNALTAVRLAGLGAFASPSGLDGEAGLFAALGKREAAARVRLFAGPPELLSVYHKPLPACNFAQTPCQAALRIARESGCRPEGIASVLVRVSRAGAAYPGCDYRGPFAHVLQAKMSIQYNVAAALIRGELSEDSFALLDDARVRRLIGLTTLQVDDEMTRAYPGKQGAEVEVRETSGATHRVRLDDVVNATAAEVRKRFRGAAASVLGAARAAEIEGFIDRLELSEDIGHLGALLRGAPRMPA